MNMAKSPDEIIKKFNEKHSSKVERWIDPLTGKLGHDDSRILIAKYTQRIAGKIVYSTAKSLDGKDDRGEVTGDEASELFSLVSNLALPGGDHLLAKSNKTWQALYHRDNRDFKLMKPNGTTGNALLPSYPCHYCGMFVTEDDIQIDHRHPQAGEAGLWVAKVLHSIRTKNVVLTEESASGAKNKQAMDIATGKGVNPVPVKGWDRGAAWKKHAAAKNGDDKYARYQLTDDGIVFLTIAVMVHGLTDFPNACLNSLLNLVPSCSLCNRSKSSVPFAHKG